MSNVLVYVTPKQRDGTRCLKLYYRMLEVPDQIPAKSSRGSLWNKLL